MRFVFRSNYYGRAAWRDLVPCCVFVSLVAGSAFASESAGTRRYDLPARDAAGALKLFSEQSGRGVIAGTDLVKGIRTNRVIGEHTAADALGRMLAGTGLTGIEDSKSGTFAVRKETEAEKKGAETALESPKKKRTTLSPTQQPMKRNGLLARFAAVLALSVASATHAQSTGTGTIAGRIYNPATDEYVRNAEIQVEGTSLVTYSRDDGSYDLNNVPAGEITLSVTYTGYQRETARVNLQPGQIETHNFDLKGSVYQSGKDAAIMLQQFVVSSEREGNAKAIMEQRAALNIKSVVSSDNFGDVTGGNIGEFIKYLPGVVMDYNNADARAARIGGLDPKYVGVTIDGMNVASAASAAFGADTRQFEFEQASIYGMDAIEISKTTTASMDADAPAGRINLRSRNAFDRKGREITAQVTLSGNAYEMHLRKTPGPYNSDTYKILPSFVFGYAESFKQRFGVSLSLGASSLFTSQSEVTHTQMDNTNPARGLVIRGIQFRDAPIVTTRASFNIATDFRITPELVFAFRTAGSHLDGATNNRTMTLVANLAQIDPSSTLTSINALPTTNTNTRLEMTTARRSKRNDTVSYTPKLEFKRGDFTLTASGVYSRSRTAYEVLDEGMFAAVRTRLSRMGWAAERSDVRKADWNIRQTAGPSWLDAANYNRPEAFPNNVAANAQAGRNQVWVGMLDAKKTLRLGVPIQFGAGLKSKLTTYDLEKTGNLQWTYVGPTGVQSDPTTVIPTFTRYPFDPKQGGNVASIPIPRPDPYTTRDLFVANPSHFTPNLVNNHINTNYSSRGIKEQIDAGYIEGNLRWRALRANLGLRHERTTTIGKTQDLRPASQVAAAGFTPGTIPFVDYQYRNGQRTQREGGYGNTFLSGGAKYALTKSLHVQVAGSQSINRPSYNNIAGVITVDEVNQTVRTPNPDLKPETSDKYYVSLQYYIEPAGTLSLSGYKMAIKDMGLANQVVTAEEAGYGSDPEYAGYTFLRPTNAPGTRRIDGIDLEYSQQLVFLPGFWRGFSAFGSLSRTIADMEIARHVPKSANGGIRFSNQRFNAQLRCTWNAARLNSRSAVQSIWQYERIMFDLSGGFRINKRYEVTVTGRNILNSPIATYINEPGLFRSAAYFGAAWTLGVRGRF